MCHVSKIAVMLCCSNPGKVILYYKNYSYMYISVREHQLQVELKINDFRTKVSQNKKEIVALTKIYVMRTAIMLSVEIGYNLWSHT